MFSNVLYGAVLINRVITSVETLCGAAMFELHAKVKMVVCNKQHECEGKS